MFLESQCLIMRDHLHRHWQWTSDRFWYEIWHISFPNHKKLWNKTFSWIM